MIFNNTLMAKIIVISVLALPMLNLTIATEALTVNSTDQIVTTANQIDLEDYDGDELNNAILNTNSGNINSSKAHLHRKK